ncbi:MAG: phage integrase N-terminal SAM-like domain-containing protein, partial [archaeon]|nr:phage integrase N-terminal SAM-like domain-containing protein [archaeon]
MDPSISPQKQNFSPTWVEERVTRLRDELGVGGYSPRTIRMYTLYVRKYLEGLLILGKPPEEASKHDIITFLARARTATTSNATLALMHAALTFYYKRHLNLNLIEEISIPKKAKKLPVVLTIPEIRIIFKHTPPGRNRLLLQFLYSTGCRVSEAVGMKVDQVDFDNLVANV